MKKITILLAIFCSFLNATEHNATNYNSITTISNETVISGEFLGQYWNPLPESIVERIKGKSWNSDCPIPLEDLAYVQVSHWNYNNEIVTGELIYHKTLALEIIEIFQELFEAKFPIEKMVLIDDYNANDDLSMEDNNSSAFCSRAVVGYSGVFSKHSYGGTIDINPLINPYIRGNTVLPKGSEPYLDRTLDIPGLIKEGDVCYQAFIKRGYTWGGHFISLKDYQHFEKDIIK
ncbi:MAG: M15 family metallopeptidase [Chlamydiota bacterium]|jgi:hypothetical protein